MAAMGEGGGNAVIDRARFGPLQFGVTALCFIIAMLDGFDTQSIAFVAPKIAEDWGLAPSAFGPIFAIGLLGLTVGAFTLSPAADKFGHHPDLDLHLRPVRPADGLLDLDERAADLPLHHRRRPGRRHAQHHRSNQ